MSLMSGLAEPVQASSKWRLGPTSHRMAGPQSPQRGSPDSAASRDSVHNSVTTMQPFDGATSYLFESPVDFELMQPVNLSQ